ncbi:hypothetical protein HDU85_005679 [Gaertneriomyces sp. JEL0708]|nr:hypothetical protein HDU85_005679 [Gaertneriomyces sp. JEL0708]
MTVKCRELFDLISFGDLARSDVLHVVDPDSLVNYQPDWSVEALKEEQIRPSIVFGSIVVVRSQQDLSSSALPSPVAIAPGFRRNSGAGLATETVHHHKSALTHHSVGTHGPATSGLAATSTPTKKDAALVSVAQTQPQLNGVDHKLAQPQSTPAAQSNGSTTQTKFAPVQIPAAIETVKTTEGASSDELLEHPSAKADVTESAGATSPKKKKKKRRKSSAGSSMSSPVGNGALDKPLFNGVDAQEPDSPHGETAISVGKPNGVDHKHHHNEIPSPPASDADISLDDSVSHPESPAEGHVPQPTQPATPKSWASIVRSPVTSGAAAAPVKPHTVTSTAAPTNPLISFTATYTPKLIRPRGLINNGNMCFMNAILQPLLHCAPFYNLLKMLAREVAHKLGQVSLLQSMIIFQNEFFEEEPGTKLQLCEGDDRDAFAPEYVYEALRQCKGIGSVKGRQEDAEEFLGFILEGLHEELVKIQNKGQPTQQSQLPDSDASWTEVGRNSKAVISRENQITESPITKIFGGKMRSVLRCPGRKDSVTMQPYQALQLDITPDGVHSIEDALSNLTDPEVLEGFTSSKGGKIDAVKQAYIESLPPILILHLKRFVYNPATGAEKVTKCVSYPIELKINPQVISPPQRAVNGRASYRLFAVVLHRGPVVSGGHYTCFVGRQSGEWLSIDDACIKVVGEDEVLGRVGKGEAYMLFYCRS